ncbi:MAG: YfhO family protein [Pyrinomonadaceae bacterium]
MAIRRGISSRHVLSILLACGFVALACLIGFIYFREDLTAFAASRGVANFSVSPLRNNAIAIPLILLLAASAAIYFFSKRKDGLLAAILLLGVLVIDMGSFGWFCEWNYGSPGADFLERPPFATRYQESLAAAHQRMLPVRGGLGTLAEIPPNISRVWKVPSVSGYGPLILARLRQLLDMPAHGSVDGAWRDSRNQSLNILAVRYLFTPPAEELRSDTFSQQGFDWSTEDLEAALGAGCQTENPVNLRFDLDEPVKADAVGIVSTLACSAELQHGAEAAQVRLIDEEGATHVQILRAGKDASEWAYDCADVKPLVQHNRAPIFRSYPAARESGPCEGHHYVSVLDFPGLSEAVKSVEITWTGRRGSIVVQKATLLDQASHRSTPLRMSPHLLASNSAWRLVEDLTDGIKVYENQRAMPRAWLVGEVVQALPEEVLIAIKTSQLPDKRAFDARTTALIERPPPFASALRDPAARVSISELSAISVELRVTTAAAAFLVLSDVNYPGWEAFVDGRPTQIYQTDYILRGLAVPPGEHLVRLRFRPPSIAYGALLSALCLLLTLALGLFGKKFNRAFA